MAVKLKDLKADWTSAPTCFPLTEQCMLIFSVLLYTCSILIFTQSSFVVAVIVVVVVVVVFLKFIDLLSIHQYNYRAPSVRKFPVANRINVPFDFSLEISRSSFE